MGHRPIKYDGVVEYFRWQLVSLPKHYYAKFTGTWHEATHAPATGRVFASLKKPAITPDTCGDRKVTKTGVE